MGRIVCNEIDYSGSPLVTDSTPNASSVNPVTSAGVHKALVGQEGLLKDTVGFTGKNLLKIDAQTQTINGVTFTANTDGLVRVDGTATDNITTYYLKQLYNYDNFVKDTTTQYVLSGCPSGGSDNGYKIDIVGENGISWSKNDTGNGVTFSFPKIPTGNEYYRIRIRIGSGTVCNNLVFYPMLREADIMDDTYEQYHAPMSSYVDKRLRDALGVTGKNLIPVPYQDYNNGSYTYAGITFTIDSNGIITANGTATGTAWFTIYTWDKASFNIGEKYILSGCPYGGGSESYRIVFRPVRSNGDEVDWINNSGGEEELIISSTMYNLENLKGFICKIRIGSGTTVSNLKFYPMLREADILDGEYEPYHIPGVVSQEAQNVLGVKNLISYPYKDTTKTVDGITFTDNGDGTVTVNGQYTGIGAGASFVLFNRAKYTVPEGDYILSGGGKKSTQSGVSESGYYIFVSSSLNGGTAISTPYTINGDVNLHVDYSVYNEIGISIWIQKNAIMDNVKFYPMLRPISIRDDRFVIGAKTNRQLTEKTQNLLGDNGIIKFLDNTYDLDDLRNYPSGIYYWTTSPTNSPEGVGWAALLNIIRDKNSDAKQIAFTASVMYIRSYGGSTPHWTSWCKFTGTEIS